MLSAKWFTRASVLSQCKTPKAPVVTVCHSRSAGGIKIPANMKWGRAETLLSLHTLLLRLSEVSFLTEDYVSFNRAVLLLNFCGTASVPAVGWTALSREDTVEINLPLEKNFYQYFIRKGKRVGHDVIHVMCYVNKDFSTKMKFFYLD